MRQEQPVFSIVVPTYEQPRRLAACLQALARLDYPRDHFEVIVVDDGSTMPPNDAVASFRDRLQVTLLVQLHSGPATARNTGAMQAKGQYLAFTDDDCMPAPEWLQSLTVRFAKTPDHMIGGRTINALPDNLYSTACQVLVDYLYTYYNADLNHGRFFTSNNLALPADRFRLIGGFDTTFPLAGGEDLELCHRWLHRGYQLTYAPEILIYHAHALTFRTFWRQQFCYGRGAFRFHRARVARSQESIRLEPLSFYQNLLRHPFSQVRGGRALSLAALMVVSQIANASGFFREKLRQSNWLPTRRTNNVESGRLNGYDAGVKKNHH